MAAAADSAPWSRSWTQDSLRQMTRLRNARGKKLRKLQAEKNEIREKLREEETPRVANMQVYRAMAWLQDGVVRNAAGEAVGEASPMHKLNRAAVKAIEPEPSQALVYATPPSASCPTRSRSCSSSTPVTRWSRR